MVFKKLPYQYGLGPCVQNLQELDITGFIQVIVYALFAYPKISQFLVPVKFLMEEFCRNIIFTRLISCRCYAKKPKSDLTSNTRCIPKY